MQHHSEQKHKSVLQERRDTLKLPLKARKNKSKYKYKRVDKIRWLETDKK